MTRWQDLPGAGIVRADLIGTVVFVVTAVVAAVVFDDVSRALGVVVALVLFAVGVFTFLWGYWTAVQRSRTEQLAVSELYFLTGPAVPASVRRWMDGALAVQAAVGLGTALARPSTDGRAGSTLAFGVLVPMFGLGLNGLWAARHGSFGPRQRARGSDGSAEIPDADRPME